MEKPKPQTPSTTSLGSTTFTDVPDTVDTKIPDFDLGNPLTGATLNVEPEIDSSKLVFITSEIQPEPIGGFVNFYRTVSQNLKYPHQAKMLGVEGKVFVDFVVDRFGKATNIKIIKGIGAGCDDEAMRVVAIPKWNAGRQRGKAVNVRIGLQINFKLDR
jgi:protein TonB